MFITLLFCLVRFFLLVWWGFFAVVIFVLFVFVCCFFPSGKQGLPRSCVFPAYARLLLPYENTFLSFLSNRNVIICSF